MFNFLISKFQLFSCIGVASVSVISLPTTLALTSTKRSGSIFKPLNDAFEDIKAKTKDKFSSFDKELNTQYTNFGNKVANEAVEGPQAASAKLQSIGDGASSVAKIVNNHAATINHGAFRLGHLIKALLKHVPNIIKESIVESISGGQDKHLLSVQKLYNIASNEKFGEFVGAMSEVVSKHGKLLENLSGEDNSGIIQIFKELQNEEKAIEQFLTKAKDNTSKLDDENSYQCATKLMMHVLIGKEEMQNIKTTIDNLKQMLETFKTNINAVLAQGSGSSTIDVGQLTSKLDDIKSKTDHITDPCSKSSN